MLYGTDLGRALGRAIELKGVSQKEVAAHFGVKPPSVTDWLKFGVIAKKHLPKLWAYFSDVVGPEHWGLDRYPTGDNLSLSDAEMRVALAIAKLPAAFGDGGTKSEFVQQLLGWIAARPTLGAPVVDPWDEAPGMVRIHRSRLEDIAAPLFGNGPGDVSPAAKRAAAVWVDELMKPSAPNVVASGEDAPPADQPPRARRASVRPKK